MGGGKLDRSRDGVVEEDLDLGGSEQSTHESRGLLASNRVSLQAWLLRLLRLFHAGGRHRREGDVPPRLFR